MFEGYKSRVDRLREDFERWIWQINLFSEGSEMPEDNNTTQYNNIENSWNALILAIHFVT